jgi:hypothetical protein
MKQVNFTWGRVPLSILMFLCLGLSSGFAQTLSFTSPDIFLAAGGQQQCRNSPVGLTVTGLAANQSVSGYEFSNNGGGTWTIFGATPPPAIVNDNNIPILDGRQYRAKIATTTVVTSIPLVVNTTFSFTPVLTIGILTDIANPLATAPDVICQDAPNTLITFSGNNAIGYNFVSQLSSPEPGACLSPSSNSAWFGATGPINAINFDWYEGFHGTYSITVNAGGCVAGVPGVVPITKTITIRRSIDASQTCATTPITPTTITGPRVVCEGDIATYTFSNPFAFANAANTFPTKYRVNLVSATAALPENTDNSTQITFPSNYTGGNNPTIAFYTFTHGCVNPLGDNNGVEDNRDDFNDFSVYIQKRPILNSLRAEKTVSCAGECVNFFVEFDYVNGSNGSVIVDYTVNDVPQAPVTLPANANGALLTSICNNVNYTVNITGVRNNGLINPNIPNDPNNCTQLITSLPPPVTVTVSPVPVVNSITSNIDDDGNTTGVQVCEDPARTIVLTAVPNTPGFTYQWKKDGVNIPGATVSTFSFQAIPFTGVNETAVFEVMVMSPGCTNTASRTINVTILKKPILNTLTAEKILTCEGECVNFLVGFNYFSGSNAPVIVTYTINGVLQPAVTIAAGANPALLANLCRTTDYTVAITSVRRAALPICAQTDIFPNPVSVTVRPTPVVNTLTSNVDEDAVAPGVQKCEDPTANITLTALPTHPTFTYVWKKDGVIIPNATSNTYTFPATLTDQANLSETSKYQVMVMSSTCPGSAMRDIDVTIFKKPVGGIVSPALKKVCGAQLVTLELSGKVGTVEKWQRDVGCTGVFTDIANTTTTLTFTTVPNTIVCYRAIVKNGTCAGVPSSVARVEADAPAVGGFVSLSNNMSVTMTAICPNDNITLKVNGILPGSKVVNWQRNRINSPVWTNLTDQTGLTLPVAGSTLTSTTFYRAYICSPLGICTGTAAFAYSSVFKVSLKAICAPPPPAPASTLVGKTGVPLNNAVISKAFPIPSNHRVTLEIEGASEGDAQIEVMDLMGKVAIKETKFLQLGTNEVSFDISNLSNGIYIVKFVDSEKHSSSIKITKAN